MADKVVGNLTIRLDFDGAKFEQGMTQAKRELASYGKATKMSADIARKDNFEKGKTIDALNNMQVRYKGLNSMVQVYAKENERLGKLEGDHTGAMAKNEQQMQNLKYEMYQLNDEYKRFQKESLTAQSGFTKFGNAAISVGGALMTAGEGITNVGNGLTKVGGIASGTLGALAKSAIEFETGMVNVQKTTNATSAEMEVFERDIRGLSLTMPLAVGELQNLASQAGQLGVAQKDISSFTESVAKIGTATNLSSEQASESLARFTNITGSSVANVDNLGSALVHLGNNFATSESEIMNLSMGLAGSLTTVGASEAQILGLSTAMSSMGITAERGASSMSKFFVDIASDVSNGSERLETFAQVSNMTVEEFKQAFQEDAVGAVEAFITGLGGIEESGGDVLQVMDELGINEVRLRDTVLRLAQGHELFGEALDASSVAYKEGTALNDEYEQQLNSTAAQVQLAKNQLADLGITIGQQLLPAILDLLNNSDGVVDWLKEAVDWFVNLDDGMKENIVKWSALALVLGPVLSGFGNMVTGLGSMVTLIGSTSKKLEEFSGTIKSKVLPFLMDIAGNSKIAGDATIGFGEALGLTAKGGLKKLVASITGSTGLMVALGVAGTALAGWVWWKKWGEDAYEAGERTKKWGADVGEETEKVLNDFQDLSDGVRQSTDSMAEDAEKGGQSAVEGYRKMVEGITGMVDENIADVQEFYNNLDNTTRKTLEDSTQTHIDELTKVKDESEKIYGKINDIYAKAMAENRELTDSEVQAVENLTKKLADLQAEATAGTEEQIKQTRKVLKEHLEGMTKEQLEQRSLMLSQDLAATKENYDQQLQELDKLHASGKISKEEYHDSLLSMEQAYGTEIQSLLDQQIETYRELGYEESEIVQILSSRYKEYGYTREQVEQRVQNSLRATQDEIFASDKYWSDLMLDPKTGEIKTNIPEVLADVYEADGSWENIELEIKEADWTTNTQQIMYEFLMASGYWDELDPEVKKLLADANGFMTEMGKSEERLARWDALPEEDKLILGDNKDFALAVMDSQEKYDMWMKLPEEDKHMLGNNKDLLKKVFSSKEEYQKWLNMPEPAKKIKAKDEATATINRIQRQIDGMRGKTLTIRANMARAGNSSSSKKFVQGGGGILYEERGTNNHPGGLAMVNDQSSSLFRELVTLPSGESFIPKGRNVMLDLPKGSKVLRSALTKNMFPDLKQYENGIGTQTVPKGFGESKQTDNSSNDTYNIYITANGDLPDASIRNMAEKIEQEIKKRSDRKRASQGERVSFA